MMRQILGGGGREGKQKRDLRFAVLAQHDARRQGLLVGGGLRPVYGHGFGGIEVGWRKGIRTDGRTSEETKQMRGE